MKIGVLTSIKCTSVRSSLLTGLNSRYLRNGVAIPQEVLTPPKPTETKNPKTPMSNKTQTIDGLITHSIELLSIRKHKLYSVLCKKMRR